MPKEEMVEAKILDYGKLKSIYSSILFAREYAKVVKDGPPPRDIPKELYYQAVHSTEVKYGPLKVVSVGNLLKVSEVNAVVKSEREGIPLYAIVDFTNGIRVYLAYERPKTIVGVDIGVRHLFTIVAIRGTKPWKVRYWGNELIMDEMIKILGDPQGLTELRNMKIKIKGIVDNVVKFIDELEPKIVAIEDLKMFEGKAGQALRVVEEMLEDKLYIAGIKFRRLSPFNTSKICSNCGYRKGEIMGPLFVCPACGFKSERDYNAAYNIALQCYYQC
ncbi:zinc ribbon domain-containing protein [Stygiolobus caldivivus]|uniref:Transposase n=1 Tax=Stygiolobus caldivivus TaxID=2824673 RepID=A0A8D5U5U7_9CREN|nr:zinc ribbon domain-containing protein [Stygiolobus caldivivus]BCU69411.1 transposase [Stygiolobus caldivivus]